MHRNREFWIVRICGRCPETVNPEVDSCSNVAPLALSAGCPARDSNPGDGRHFRRAIRATMPRIGNTGGGKMREVRWASLEGDGVEHLTFDRSSGGSSSKARWSASGTAVRTGRVSRRVRRALARDPCGAQGDGRRHARIARRRCRPLARRLGPRTAGTRRLHRHRHRGDAVHEFAADRPPRASRAVSGGRSTSRTSRRRT